MTLAAKKESVRAYVTKYALTEGVFSVEAEICHGISSTMISTKTRGYYHGRDWHRTPEDALKRVAEMVETKRKTIAKQVAHLDKIDAALCAGTYSVK